MALQLFGKWGQGVSWLKQYGQRPLGIKSDQRKSNNTLHIDYLAHLPYDQDSSFNFGIALGCQHIGMTGRS